MQSNQGNGKSQGLEVKIFIFVVVMAYAIVTVCDIGRDMVSGATETTNEALDNRARSLDKLQRKAGTTASGEHDKATQSESCCDHNKRDDAAAAKADLAGAKA